MGLDVRKPVIGVSNQVITYPACSATETTEKMEILLASHFDMILSKRQMTKALIRVCRCTCWSAPLLLQTTRQVFSHQGQYCTLF